MNAYMKRVILQTFSYFDTGKNASQEEPERGYHGFVLGLIANGISPDRIRKYGFAFEGKQVLIGTGV